MAGMINPGDNEYPKMVYPHGNNVHHQNAGSPDVGDFAGKLVHNKEEEDKVMKDAPKEDKKADPKEGEAGWTANPNT
jgi:hypothetical protein